MVGVYLVAITCPAIFVVLLKVTSRSIAATYLVSFCAEKGSLLNWLCVVDNREVMAALVMSMVTVGPSGVGVAPLMSLQASLSQPQTLSSHPQNFLAICLFFCGREYIAGRGI